MIFRDPTRGELKASFSNEAMLCATFIRHVPAEWQAYPETGNFDILLVRLVDGAQLGVEAKLTLNAKVIHQVVESESHWRVADANPDFRAVLIPWGAAAEGMAGLCHLLGITVIRQHNRRTWEYHKSRGWGPRTPKFEPVLPAIEKDHWRNWGEDWVDWAPSKRLTLPAYVPDVAAGASAPIALTHWKIKALRIAAVIERRGFVTREDFKHLQLDHRRWLDPRLGWLERGDLKGQYVDGDKSREFRAQHPRNYAEILADFDTWAPKGLIP